MEARVRALEGENAELRRRVAALERQQDDRLEAMEPRTRTRSCGGVDCAFRLR